METGKPIFLILLVLCFMSSDMLHSSAIAGRHGRGGHGIEYLLAAGILAKLLRKKQQHHHHHHGHHGHHGHHHHHGRHAEAGSIPAIPMALPPPPPPPPMIHPHQGVHPYHHASHPHPAYHHEHYPSSATSTSFSASIDPLFNFFSAQPSNLHMMFGAPSTNIQYYQEPPRRIPSYSASTDSPSYSAPEQELPSPPASE